MTTTIAAPRRSVIAHRAFSWALKDLNTRERTFEGYLSTWDVDLGGDVVHRGAFAETLKEWKSSGEVIPLLDGHNYWSIRSAVGRLVEAKEDRTGLWTKWFVINGDDGDAALDRLEGGVITKMSMGYEPLDFKYERDEEAQRMMRHLTRVGLKEGSLVIFPMNPNAAIDLDSIKAFTFAAAEQDPALLSEMDRKALRRLASKVGLLLRNPATGAGTKQEGETDDGVQDDPTGSADGGAPPADPAAAAPSGGDAPQDGGSTQVEGEGSSGAEPEGQKAYEYVEALQERLKRTLSLPIPITD